MSLFRPLIALAALPLVMLQGCAAGQADVASVSSGSVAPATTPAATGGGPALWKVADADTTIYLFGTIHALPADVDWYGGPVAAALGSAELLVTEIPSGAMEDPAIQAEFQKLAMLPAGQSLRDQLSAEQRATYEGALAKLGLPLAAFDRVKPWFAAITMSVMPLLKAGYDMENGVENAVEAKAGADVERAALESAGEQLAIFDSLPLDVQRRYLAEVAEQIDEVVPTMNQLLAKWSVGDADGLAALVNDEVDDPVLADALLYKRNRNWATWVRNRLDRPGTVFIAVGAGHLGGPRSVQDYLAKDGLQISRVQ